MQPRIDIQPLLRPRYAALTQNRLLIKAHSLQLVLRRKIDPRSLVARS